MKRKRNSMPPVNEQIDLGLTGAALLQLLYLFFRLWARVAATIYGAEGINIPLMFMPTQVIALTLRTYGARIGQHVRFRSPLVIHNADSQRRRYYQKLEVGDDCYFGRELFLDLQDKIVIEDHVTVSHRVMIITHTDVGTSPLKDKIIATSQAPVMVRSGAYIGANVTILQGVEIGSGSIVGAGAVVARSVPPGSVVVGVPARVIKTHQDGRGPRTQSHESRGIRRSDKEESTYIS